MLEKLISVTNHLILFIDIILSKLNSDYKYYNGKYFDLFITEVNSDIKTLKHFSNCSEYERDKEFFEPLSYKYKHNYCPSTFYKYFSDENKLEYCYKRVEIDELLNK